MTVKVAQRAITAIAEHATGSVAITACGILIGRRAGHGFLIERTLRCFNAAPCDARSGAFEIDPRVLVNLRRSLAGSGAAVLGFYYGSRDPLAEPAARDLEHLRLWPDTVLLIKPAERTDEGACRTWIRTAGEVAVRELPSEVVASKTPSLLVCPE